ncbi:MAG: hypothetical protein II365_00845 [Clostridia bacterium]|nr:hypothetical protein [Clostridia bacterium]
MREDEIPVKITETEARSKSNMHRIERLERDSEVLYKIATSVEILATKQSHLANAIVEVDKKVTALEKIPSRRWRTLVDKVIGALTGLIIGYLANSVFFS